jgi:hypothetical protein
MAKYSSLGPVFAILLAGCGPDSDDGVPDEPGSQPEADDDDQDEPGLMASDAAARKPDRSMDAALAMPRVEDAAMADAGSGDAARGTMQADASRVQVVSDAGDRRDAAPDAADAALPPAAARTVKVVSKDVWTASGFEVEAGRCYQLEAKIDDPWRDLDVPADLSGWIDKKDARIALFAPFRRVAQDDIGFYQFATCVNKKLDQCFPVGASSTVCPKVSGELFFFVNDVSGFESNNVGTATVSVRAK